MKLLKYFGYLVLVVVICYFFLFGYFYKKGESELEQLNFKSEITYPNTVRQILWASFGGQAEISNNSYSYIDAGVMFIKYGVFNNDSSINPELMIYAQTASNILFLTPNSEKINDMNKAKFASPFYVSQKLTINESLDSYLDKSYYGKSVESFYDAAEYFYNKNVVDLDVNQILSLVTASHGSMFSPACATYRAHRMRRIDTIVSRLKTNWPDKYADYQYEEPLLADRDFPEC